MSILNLSIIFTILNYLSELHVVPDTIIAEGFQLDLCTKNVQIRWHDNFWLSASWLKELMISVGSTKSYHWAK